MAVIGEDILEGLALLYEICPTGGAAGYVTDDGNVEDEYIQWCLDNLSVYSKTYIDAYYARYVLERLLKVDYDTRLDILESFHESLRIGRRKEYEREYCS